MMTKTLKLSIAAVSIFALMATGALAQGWGRGQGGRWGGGQGYYANGTCPQGYVGGWQGRIQNVADPALSARIAELHNQIRQIQWNMRADRAQGLDTTAAQAEVDALRADLKAANEEAGLCTGDGPHAYGMQQGWGGRGMGYGQGYGQARGMQQGWGGRGMGRGQGYGLRNGQGYGLRNGQGYGARNGQGRGMQRGWGGGF